jgi:class 3 adenylate cyclase
MKFCGACGAALVAAAPVQGVRKVVTAVFCDVTGSTALGQRLDPKALRGLMESHFATVSEALTRHGGTESFGRVDDLVTDISSKTSRVPGCLASIFRDLGGASVAGGVSR